MCSLQSRKLIRHWALDGVVQIAEMLGAQRAKVDEVVGTGTGLVALQEPARHQYKADEDVVLTMSCPAMMHRVGGSRLSSPCRAKQPGGELTLIFLSWHVASEWRDPVSRFVVQG
jgi:hypothetical protein